jgi:hypothetical protein
MATDYTTTYAGNYPGAANCKITCILNDGDPTVSTRVYGPDGLYTTGLTWSAELYPGDYVAIANDTAVTFDACDGLPVVEKAVDKDTLVIGKIISEPVLQVMPPSSTAGNSLTKRLAGRYYRTALVEIMGGITKIDEAIVQCDGSNATVPGVTTTLNLNIADTYANHKLCFIQAASNGAGYIPFHYVPATTAGDTHTILVGITGLMYSATGS